MTTHKEACHKYETAAKLQTIEDLARNGWVAEPEAKPMPGDKLPFIAVLCLAVVIPMIWYACYDYIIWVYEVLFAWGV